MKIFAERLTALRNEKGMTQKEISKLLNITQQGYDRYELDESIPSHETLVQIGDILECSIDYLLGRVDYYTTIWQPSNNKGEI